MGSVIHVTFVSIFIGSFPIILLFSSHFFFANLNFKIFYDVMMASLISLTGNNLSISVARNKRTNRVSVVLHLIHLLVIDVYI